MSKVIDMSRVTTFGIGGKAVITEVKSIDEARCVLQRGAFVLGNGSNILVSDYGVSEPVIANCMRRVEIEDGRVVAQSGVNVSLLAKRLALQGVSGLEWAYGLPASLGGAIVMNAGAFGKTISDAVLSVDVLRGGRIITLSNEKCGFGYRRSAFEPDDFIVSATLRVEKKSEAECLTLLNTAAEKRKRQPKGKSAGCIYKTGEKSAGWYIDSVGLKGEREGDIYISPVHAGFFINAGGGTAKQVLTLMQRAERRVYEAFGVRLEKEIKLIGDF